MSRHFALLSLLLGACFASASATVEGNQVLSQVKLAELPQDLATDGSTDESSATSILTGLRDILDTELHSEDQQWACALIAFIFGATLFSDSRSSICYVVVAANMVLTCVFTQSEISSLWHLPIHDVLCLFVGVQMAILVGWATYKGIEGALLVVFALLGALLGRLAQGPLIFAGVYQLQDSRWCISVFYTIFIWLALGMYKKNLHRPILAVLCSVVGAALITSSLMWALTLAYLQNMPSGDLHPQGGTWIDFFFMLFTPGAKDIGIFAGSPKPKDIMLSRLFWCFLSLVGIVLQMQQLKAAGAGAARAREGLSEKLLVAVV